MATLAALLPRVAQTYSFSEAGRDRPVRLDAAYSAVVANGYEGWKVQPYKKRIQ